MLEVRNIYKSYEGQALLRGVSFLTSPDETVCLLGPSGSGKSTLLRIIAGLEETEGGQVLWQGQDMAGIPVHKRNFGLMFQDYALFPHRDVAENVAFGLRMQGLPRPVVNDRVEQALRQVNMLALAQRRVTDLSGGEQQRVALARALAPAPRLLMLDEPLAALDRSLRETLSEELRRILHAAHIPAIYVTHDQQEAFAIADRLVVLQDGRVAQDATPAEIYAHPASAWVAEFFGLGSLLHGKIAQIDPLQVETNLGVFQIAAYAHPNSQHSYQLGQPASLLLRPAGAQLLPRGHLPAYNCVEGVVTDSVFHGETYRTSIRTAASSELWFNLPEPNAIGTPVQLHIPPDGVTLLPE
jgi:ABC-type Fe3+/spermidine/putrescine transport system ATPase subunit